MNPMMPQQDVQQQQVPPQEQPVPQEQIVQEGQPAPQQQPVQQEPPSGMTRENPGVDQKRDYKANPLNEKDKARLNQYIAKATAFINSKQTREKVLGRIKGKAHPFKDIARAAAVVAQRVETDAQKGGVELDNAVKQVGLAHVVKQIGELANAAGKINRSPTSEDLRAIYAEAVKQRTSLDMTDKKLSPKQVLDDVGDFTNDHFQRGGKDVAGYYQSIAEVMNQKKASDPSYKEKPQNREPISPDRMTVAQRMKGGLL